MPGESKTPEKDKWDILQITAQALIPVVALAFTVLFGLTEQTNQAATRQLATSNFELAKSQVKISLLPSLSSEDARRRAMALYLARILDEAFAAEVAGILAVSDPSEDVRNTARSTLASLSQSPRDRVKEKALEGVDRYDVMNELRTKRLLTKLRDAQDYIDGGAPNASEEALKRYREVLTQLSVSSVKKLDQNLLANAKKDDREGRIDHAARAYRALFSDYTQPFFHQSSGR